MASFWRARMAARMAGMCWKPAIRAAIRARQKLAITYPVDNDTAPRRVVRPLELEYWGRIWTTTCWCESSNDFKEFRVDRIETLTVLPALFVEEQGKTLIDYRARL